MPFTTRYPRAHDSAQNDEHQEIPRGFAAEEAAVPDGEQRSIRYDEVGESIGRVGLAVLARDKGCDALWLLCLLRNHD